LKKAVILFSGGLDSTTCLAIAKANGFECYALSFNYGQKHAAELEAAKRITQAMGNITHMILDLPLAQLGGSALTDKNLSVPDFKNHDSIPITYVPARNTIFLSFALGWAEVLKANDIFIGANAIDFSNYPDCRPDYIQAYETLANLATKAGREGNHLNIHSPLLHLTKAEIIQLGVSLGIDYSKTVSCYSATSDGQACGKCDSCTFRIKGFRDAKIADVTYYATPKN
jgi:7-cyano-7-deazaguanine synthase